jgi:outer membrane protein assembly factor BamB
MKDIRHIATSFNGKRFAVAEFKTRVQILDLETLTPVSEFDTILDYGGRRIVISEDGKICVCGCWERHGIIGYDSSTGEKLWQRKELKKVQHIQLVRTNHNQIFTHFAKGVSRFLDIRTGEDVDTVKATEHFYKNKYSGYAILDKLSGIEITEYPSFNRRVKIDRQSFATLDIANGTDSVLISESGGPLSCHQIDTGELLWRHELDQYGHYLRLNFNEELNAYLGICWSFETGGDKRLRFFEPSSGKILDELNLGCPAETEFAFEGGTLVTSDSDVIDLRTKKIKHWAQHSV